MTMSLEQVRDALKGGWVPTHWGTDGRSYKMSDLIESLDHYISQPHPVAQGEVVDVEGDYDWRKGPIEFEDSDGVKWYGYPRPTSPTREAVAGLECPGITSWNSFCKNCKAPAHVCFDTNCNGSGSGYEAVGNVTHKCKCGPTIPAGHRVVPVAPKLIGWRMADYMAETADPEKAKNWSTNVAVLPIFEGDPHTKLSAAHPGPTGDEDEVVDRDWPANDGSRLAAAPDAGGV